MKTFARRTRTRGPVRPDLPRTAPVPSRAVTRAPRHAFVLPSPR